MNKKTIAVVGGGSAGVIAASYLKTYFQDWFNIKLIYDHSKPGIGVGESLTPKINDYLERLGITTDELIQNVNATIKIGLKFKNWLNDGNYYVHSFFQPGLSNSPYNWGPAYDIANHQYDHDYTYGDWWYKNNRVPMNYLWGNSVHIDATLFSKYIEKRFANKLEIIDDVVEDIVLKDKENIDYLILKNKGKISADFYVDATGFSALLISKLDNKWVDRSDQLPLNKCIPNPVEWNFEDHLPPYTTAEATDQGWILQVPLQNRWGTGYIYSDEFCSDDRAFNNFEKFLQKNYQSKLTNTSRIISFQSGYWKKQWIGNCIGVGLASGFSEPLEATNIHHTVVQLEKFANIYCGEIYQSDIDVYNKSMSDLYENIYLYLRFCYTTGRTDSDFWKYMTSNTPYDVKNLEEKISNSILTVENFKSNSLIFYEGNFTKVAYGLGKINPKKYYDIIRLKFMEDYAKKESDYIKNVSNMNMNNSVDHLELINHIKQLAN